MSLDRCFRVDDEARRVCGLFICTARHVHVNESDPSLHAFDNLDLALEWIEEVLLTAMRVQEQNTYVPLPPEQRVVQAVLQEVGDPALAQAIAKRGQLLDFLRRGGFDVGAPDRFELKGCCVWVAAEVKCFDLWIGVMLCGLKCVEKIDKSLEKHDL